VPEPVNSQIFEVFFAKIELEIALEILDFVLDFASAKHRNAYRQSFKILIQVHLSYIPKHFAAAFIIGFNCLRFY
jgi:hypothetical protein